MCQERSSGPNGDRGFSCRVGHQRWQVSPLAIPTIGYEIMYIHLNLDALWVFLGIATGSYCQAGNPIFTGPVGLAELTIVPGAMAPSAREPNGTVGLAGTILAAWRCFSKRLTISRL